MSGREDTWQQYRRISCGDIDAVHDGYGGSVDMDINVQTTEDGLTFDVALWNLADDTWAGVSEGDPCRISLGWDGGIINHILFGVVSKKYHEPDDRDVKHILKGEDETKAQTKVRFSQTWRDRQPNEIVRSIAREIGLTAGRIDSVGSTIEGNYCIKDDEPVRYWLDELQHEAEARTDEQWEWYCQAGQLFFERKESDQAQATLLSYENTLVSLTGSDGNSDKTDEGDDIEFVTLCEPDIQKNSLVAVDTERYSGVYKVTDYQFESNSVSGDHTTRGTAVPAGSQYEWRGRGGTGGGMRGGGGVGQVM